MALGQEVAVLRDGSRKGSQMQEGDAEEGVQPSVPRHVSLGPRSTVGCGVSIAWSVQPLPSAVTCVCIVR